jgi:hypothetical protein
MNGFDMIGVAGIMGLSFLLMMSLVMVALFACWIWALVDILKNEFTGSNKLIWLLAVIMVPLIGMILYWIIGREQKIRDSGGGTPEG